MPSRKSSVPEAVRRRPGGRTSAVVQLTLTFETHGLVAGVDEAGCGPLAGPVVAAAVILDPRDPIDGLADSKVLTPRRREQLAEAIRARSLSWGVAEASAAEIDALNIYQATMLAMRRAIEALRLKPAKVVIDGNRLPRLPMPAEAIVKGDATVPCISAASILAKVHRDRLCADLHEQYPLYGFADHKGYATAVHLSALRRHGPCPVHRQSFAPVRLWNVVAPPARGAVEATLLQASDAGAADEGVAP